MRQFIGIVTYTHPMSSRVQVSCPQAGEHPLSTKATYRGFTPEQVAKGTQVLIEETYGGYKGWKVVLAGPNLRPEPANVGPADCRRAVAPERDDEHVDFALPPRYFQRGNARSPNGMRMDTCIKVLFDAFGPAPHNDTWRRLLDEAPTGGLRLRCRLDQFARFIVRRYEANECINGIRDLEPAIHKTQAPERLSERLMSMAQLDMDSARRALEALGLEDREVRDDTIIDVTCTRETM